MIAENLNLLSNVVNRLPGWARLWVALSTLSLPGYAISLYLYRQPDLNDLVVSTLGIWATFSLLSLAIIYIIKIVIEMLIWIWQGFAESTQVTLRKVALPSAKIGLGIAFVLLWAAYFRYDVATLGDMDGRYYHYIVWDRWTGHVYADSARYKPKRP